MSWRVRVRTRAGALSLDVDLAGGAAPLALIGANGSGKTTLLRVIAGAHAPLGGEIVVRGVTLYSDAQQVDLPSEARGVGYVPQGYGLFPHLSVLDNVAFGLPAGRSRQARVARRARACDMLESLACAHLADRRPDLLSGGERQRVALARALVIEPGILLLDEPLAALDAAGRRSVRDFLAARLRAARVPSIVVTHDVRDVVALDAEVCVLDRGAIVQRGDVASLRAAPASAFVEEFMG
jgi:molybdate transport system ATP-binding protein